MCSELDVYKNPKMAEPRHGGNRFTVGGGS